MPNMIDAYVSQDGISNKIDGIGDFFGQIAGTVGDNVLRFTDSYLTNEFYQRFPEQAPPVDTTGSSGSPRDTAINEINNGAGIKTELMNKTYILYGFVALGGLIALALIIRR